MGKNGEDDMRQKTARAPGTTPHGATIERQGLYKNKLFKLFSYSK